MSYSATGRIAARFADLKAKGRAGFVTFVTAGDPTFEQSKDILLGLPNAGADIIELGMPFSDPMAEGKPIQASSLRALQSGHTMAKTFELVRAFRAQDRTTPLILMGYYNPVYAMGPARFCRSAHDAGVDGLIIVDLPPEEDGELRAHTLPHGLDLIRLATPTSSPSRLKTIAQGATGFIYYVSVTGVTGQKSIDAAATGERIKALKSVINLPLAVGFGIRTPEDARKVAHAADAVVVGSALVSAVAPFVHGPKEVSPGAVDAVLSLAKDLSRAVHGSQHVG